jgi:hypothetical protein
MISFSYMSESISYAKKDRIRGIDIEEKRIKHRIENEDKTNNNNTWIPCSNEEDVFIGLFDAVRFILNYRQWKN